MTLTKKKFEIRLPLVKMLILFKKHKKIDSKINVAFKQKQVLGRTRVSMFSSFTKGLFNIYF